MESIDKGICLQGGQPAEGQVDDPQDLVVDECCKEEEEGEAQGEGFNRRPLEEEYHGQEEGKDADHAEENGNEDGDDEDKKYLKLTKAIRHSPLSNLILQYELQTDLSSATSGFVHFFHHICFRICRNNVLKYKLTFPVLLTINSHTQT